MTAGRPRHTRGPGALRRTLSARAVVALLPRAGDRVVSPGERLQPGLLVGADHELAEAQQPPLRQALVEIQDAPGLGLEVGIARDLRALLPRLQRAVVQPAPDRRGRRVRDALLDEQAMQLSAREPAQRPVRGRQLDALFAEPSSPCVCPSPTGGSSSRLLALDLPGAVQRLVGEAALRIRQERLHGTRLAPAGGVPTDGRRSSRLQRMEKQTSRTSATAPGARAGDSCTQDWRDAPSGNGLCRAVPRRVATLDAVSHAGQPQVRPDLFDVAQAIRPGATETRRSPPGRYSSSPTPDRVLPVIIDYDRVDVVIVLHSASGTRLFHAITVGACCQCRSEPRRPACSPRRRCRNGHLAVHQPAPWGAPPSRQASQPSIRAARSLAIQRARFPIPASSRKWP